MGAFCTCRHDQFVPFFSSLVDSGCSADPARPSSSSPRPHTSSARRPEGETSHRAHNRCASSGTATLTVRWRGGVLSLLDWAALLISLCHTLGPFRAFIYWGALRGADTQPDRGTQAPDGKGEPASWQTLAPAVFTALR